MIQYLLRLFNISINKSIFPQCWELATVVPIHKSGDKMDVSSYRPISLTCVFCKVLVDQFLHRVININGWFYKGQYGFRAGFSCDSHLILLFQKISDEVDNGEELLPLL